MRNPDHDDDDDVAADLRAMFADERLTLPVGQDAVSSVVAGAGRRRRRRTVAMATGGALGVAAVLLAGGLVAGHLVPGNTAQTAGPGGGLATTSLARTTAPGPDQAGPVPSDQGGGPGSRPAVLGPDGYGSLTLGMSLPRALATKMINARTRTINGCYDYQYTAAQASRPAVSGEPGPYDVYISTREQPTGIQAISAPSGVTTPEGIGVGSTAEEIRADYPNATAIPREGVIVIGVPTNSQAQYRFLVDAKDTVTAVYLTVTGSTCPN
ncbi:MAG TPA: hypothetical protein VHX38_36405 [Pseudonocardiaceae bacterium]|jgi:hypothetical protein|nr:hypothetical protein [Pseudonocardiaceae bacterium]